MSTATGRSVAPHPARVGLLRGHPDFRRLWIGQSISQVGTQISSLAVPLIAILTLNEPAFVVGALTAVGYSPYLVVGLPAGAWVDRLARRPIMLTTDLLRAALLGSLPISMVFGVITLPLLFVVVFAVGVCTVFFEVAYRAYVPHLVGRDHLIEANSRLAASSTVAGTGGPALGGWLVSVISAPTAVLIDAVSYLISAAYITAIRTRERPPRTGSKPDLPPPSGIQPDIETLGAVTRTTRTRTARIREISPACGTRSVPGCGSCSAIGCCGRLPSTARWPRCSSCSRARSRCSS